MCEHFEIIWIEAEELDFHPKVTCKETGVPAEIQFTPEKQDSRVVPERFYTFRCNEHDIECTKHLVKDQGKWHDVE